MTNFIQEPPRQTPIVAHADVVVVGGGIAGVSAAVSAAKNGAQVLLIEAQSVLGGTILGGSSVLNSFTNEYKKHPEAPKKQLVRGFGQEIINRMAAAGGCPGFAPGMTLEDPNAPRQVIMLPEIWKSVSFAMMREYGIQLMTRAFFSDVSMRDENIEAVIVQHKAGRVAIGGEIFIDTSGDGDVAARAGCDMVEEHEQEKIKETTLLFGLNNVDIPALIAFGQRIGQWGEREPNGENETGLPVWSLGLNLQEVPVIGEQIKAMGVRMLHTITVGSEMYYVNTTRVRPEREAGLLTPRGVNKPN